MKKTYINPELEVIKIASQAQMLAGSQEQSAHEEEAEEYGAPAFDF